MALSNKMVLALGICKSSNHGTKQQDGVSFGEFGNHPIMALSDKMV